MSTNGNGNGKQVMTTQEPQLREVGLTQVRPGEGNIETLLISTEGPCAVITRPTAPNYSKSFAVSADHLIVDAIKQALNLEGNPQFRALVSLKIQVEVIDFQVDEVPGAINTETKEVDQSTKTACNFIGISLNDAPKESDTTLDTEVGEANGNIRF